MLLFVRENIFLKTVQSAESVSHLNEFHFLPLSLEVRVNYRTLSAQMYFEPIGKCWIFFIADFKEVKVKFAS